MLSTELIKYRGIKICPGDIFEAILAGQAHGYIHFIGKDDEYMAGHLVRGFDRILPPEKHATIEEIIK